MNRLLERVRTIPTTPAPPGPSVSFVCCIESGPLEAMTVRMVESLRRWGGAFAGCPVTAVTARWGPSLTRETRRALDRLGVAHHDLSAGNEFPWFGFWNKAIAAVHVEATAAADQIAWLDSDLFVTGEPGELHLGDDEDFAARIENFLPVNRPDSPNVPYWEAICRLFGMDYAEFPWLETDEREGKVRLHWNSGVFTWRRSRGLAREWMADFRRVLSAGVASSQVGLLLTDQVVLGVTMLRMGLRWRHLTRTHNHPVSRYILNQTDSAPLTAAKIVHYHESTLPAHWDLFVERMRRDQPHIVDWLVALGPLQERVGLTRRLFGSAVQWWRRRQYRAFETRCRRY